jgi:hypothetical protein
MTIEQAVTHLPEVKPHMIVGQIHDDDSIVAAFRIEGGRLVIELENGPDGATGGPTPTLSYQLRTRFEVKFEVANNGINFYYNDDLKFTHDKTISGGYFKAGAYVHSACRGPKKVDGESCTAHGEIVIYDLKVEHR